LSERPRATTMTTVTDILASLWQKHGRPSPILILAPTTRCGSTLLQRAINQGGDAIIYGENFILMESAPLVLAGDLSVLETKRRAADASLEVFLAGNKGMDASALFPDYGAYREMLLSFFYRISEFYRDASARHGYRRWGLKHQIANLAGFHNFVQLAPDFKSVTIFRNLVDVAKSMQTRWPENLETEAKCFEIGKRWRENLAYLLRLDRARNLVVRYEQLATGSEDILSKIEAHLGLALSREAFRKRVNAHTFDPVTGQAGETYSPPSDLPEGKLRALLQGAQPLYERIGYSAPTATMK
jgi:hypothetical protein